MTEAFRLKDAGTISILNWSEISVARGRGSRLRPTRYRGSESAGRRFLNTTAKGRIYRALRLWTAKPRICPLCNCEFIMCAKRGQDQALREAGLASCQPGGHGGAWRPVLQK